MPTYSVYTASGRTTYTDLAAATTAANNASPPTRVYVVAANGINETMVVDGPPPPGSGATYTDPAIISLASDMTTAYNTATAAQTAATTASNNASTALSTANTAATNASTALTNANTAATNASTAITNAAAASTAAAGALTQANLRVLRSGDAVTGQITAPVPNTMSAIVRKSDLINGVLSFRRYLRGVNATLTGASTLTGETVAVTEAVPGASLQVDSIKITTTTMPTISGTLKVFANGVIIYEKTITILSAILVLNQAIELLSLTATTLPTSKILIGTGVTFTASFTNGGVADIRISGDQVP